MPERCWCGRIWWDTHEHFGVAPVQFSKPVQPKPTGDRILLLLGLTFAAICLFFATSCSTVTGCTEPLTAQAISDGASVLVCANNGKTLAQCEQNQLQVEQGQLTQDVLICGELAISNAFKQAHMSNPADYPPLTDDRTVFAPKPDKSK